MLSEVIYVYFKLTKLCVLETTKNLVDRFEGLLSNDVESSYEQCQSMQVQLLGSLIWRYSFSVADLYMVPWAPWNPPFWRTE